MKIKIKLTIRLDPQTDESAAARFKLVKDGIRKMDDSTLATIILDAVERGLAPATIGFKADQRKAQK